MPLPKYKTYTVQDIYDLPEGTRAELIDGTMYMMAPPSRAHQEIVAEIIAVIRDYIKQKGGVSRHYVAPYAVFLNYDDHT